MKRIKRAVHPQSKLSQCGDFPFDIAHLLDILARIEQRRQERLRAMRAAEKC
jgi:hypothetical protein